MHPKLPGDLSIEAEVKATNVANAAVLTRIPELYPNLQSLTVSIVNPTSDDWPDDDFMFNFVMRTQHTRDREAMAFLTTVADALRALSSPALRSKNIACKHTMYSNASGELQSRSFEGPAVEMSSEVDHLVWHILDMPRAVVRFPDNRRLT
ncbi:hypothetical protein LTR65_004497 [Meristemomyces frigidus]